MLLVLYDVNYLKRKFLAYHINRLNVTVVFNDLFAARAEYASQCVNKTNALDT